MILVGQLPPDPKIKELLETIALKWDCVILAEHIANLHSDCVIGNFDPLLYALPKERWDEFAPDLLITFGGHVVSKRIKQFLRKQHPAAHWHLSLNGAAPDLFQSLTDVVEIDPVCFFSRLVSMAEQSSPESPKGGSRSLDKTELLNRNRYLGEIESLKNKYHFLWKTEFAKIEVKANNYKFLYSDLQVLKTFFPLLPANAALQLGNSSTIRNAQLFTLKSGIQAYCNRGTSGIEGSVSTAVGFAAIHSDLTFLVVGDLSFFYDINGLWNKQINNKLRILLVNNGGGEIFHLLPGLNKADSLNEYISCRHTTTGTKEWAEAMGFKYLSASNEKELKEYITTFVSDTSDKPLFLETITSMEVNEEVFKAYYHHLK